MFISLFHLELAKEYPHVPLTKYHVLLISQYFKNRYYIVYCIFFTDPGAPSPSPTNPGLPPSRPIHLVCSVDSPTSILLTWQRPLSAERITYYTVTYHLRSSLKPVAIKRRVNAENIILPELKPGREYTISVQSHHRTETKTPPDFSTTYKNCKLPLSGTMKGFVFSKCYFSLQIHDKIKTTITTTAATTPITTTNCHPTLLSFQQ